MGRAWTKADLEKLPAGMVPELQAAPTRPIPAATPKLPKEEPAPLRQIKSWLGILQIPFVTEHVFHPTRKWRFDIAILDLKLAIEYEGVFSEKSRHTTLKGYTEDARKYTQAAILGWRILRYTAKSYQDFVNDITSIINPAGG